MGPKGPLSKKKMGPSQKIRTIDFADRLRVTLIPAGFASDLDNFEKYVNIFRPQCIFSSFNFRFNIFLINGTILFRFYWSAVLQVCTAREVSGRCVTPIFILRR